MRVKCFRNFHRLYASLLTFDGLLERRLNTLRVLYLRTSSVNLRSSDNKDDDGQGYKLKLQRKDSIGQVDSQVRKKLWTRWTECKQSEIPRWIYDFHVLSAEWIAEDVRHKILQRENNRVNKNGELVLSSMKYSSQLKNLEDAVQKVEMIVEEASYVPKETTPEKKAHVRKLVKEANVKRLRVKRYLSDKKSDRKQQ
ncbi:Peptidyl-tRNA hydrolase ict1, mitochondrial [Desmophyllum pertusum]|uniref:Peptidyl-tRNA hydrolase ict1, mitochondrial n=1 Tax=Desmophyllum pertusum TaxID=174260 RepID=A0A9W9YJ80_9CNID|nr:Peptidyl-tRNA hydrolase ict1, mitochondrial [Desmophyllum pertusum]